MHNKSLSIKATEFQSFDISSEVTVIENSLFIDRDYFQNGFIKYGAINNFYLMATKKDIYDFSNKNANVDSGISGFFTDEETLKKAIDKNRKLDINRLAELLQVKLKYNKQNKKWYARPYVISFKINWKKLLENSELRNRLCNFDDKSDGRNSIEVTYGKAIANDVFGSGTGNQYYIDKQNFIDGINFGVFEYDENKSYVNDINIINEGFDNSDYLLRMNLLKINIKEKLSTVKETNNPIEQAKILNKVDDMKVNSQFDNVYDRNFIIPNYNYRAPFMYMYNNFKDIIKNSANLKTVRISIEDLNDYFSFIEFLFYKNLALKKEYNNNENDKLKEKNSEINNENFDIKDGVIKKDDILDFNIDAIEKETKSNINMIDEFDDKIDFSKIKFESVENIKAEYEKYLGNTY